jgi:hypothetical protein
MIQKMQLKSERLIKRSKIIRSFWNYTGQRIASVVLMMKRKMNRLNPINKTTFHFHSYFLRKEH